ncbi:DUF3108 domain-containing protein [Massilia sp. UMI-21]|nr:DUF3108 domain-containing protein [Massilia sp. UMI-21]
MNNSRQSTTFLDRLGRLPALCAFSLLLHLLVLACITVRVPPPPTPGGGALTVRLAALAPQRSAPEAPGRPAAVTADAPAVPAASGARPGPRPPPPPAAPSAPPDPTPSAGDAEAIQMPSRYRVSMPPSVTLAYAVRDASGQTGAASLRWETDGVRYRMAFDGVTGRIDSEGGTDDAGIAPQRASYGLGAGSVAVAFERERGAIVFEAFGRSQQDRPGSQDGATVLMQLAGIGLADPDQMQDAVDIHVGRADHAAVERYRVVGKEQLATPIGTMETLHLARGGAIRLEVWLAPQRGWLPVQLRVTAPDGSARTQVVKEIGAAPPG